MANIKKDIDIETLKKWFLIKVKNNLSNRELCLILKQQGNNLSTGFLHYAFKKNNLIYKRKGKVFSELTLEDKNIIITTFKKCLSLNETKLSLPIFNYSSVEKVLKGENLLGDCLDDLDSHESKNKRLQNLEKWKKEYPMGNPINKY